ncbi:MAG: BspA family leucine-rich repeat surface protein [Candidatus Coprovivens sp.]
MLKIGYYNDDFTLNVSNFNTSKVTRMEYMFHGCGYHSKKMITSINIQNPNIKSCNYEHIFLRQHYMAILK